MTPNHRFLATQAALASGAGPSVDDDLMARLYVAIETKTPGSLDAQEAYAYELYQNPEHRMVLDAFLLSKCPHEMIANTLSLDSSVLAVYGHLFMDVDVFRNKLELLSYAKLYSGSEHARELIRTAVTIGHEYLLWAYGKPNEDVVETRYIVRKTMIDTFFRGQAHRGNGITSAVAKEARAWMQMSVANAALLEKIDPRTTKAAVQELRIAIEGRDSTLAPDASPVPIEDILH